VGEVGWDIIFLNNYLGLLAGEILQGGETKILIKNFALHKSSLIAKIYSLSLSPDVRQMAASM
jgi:hypothetical protein